jgi:two-component system cell cycle sensor histidine kinase PleC
MFHFLRLISALALLATLALAVLAGVHIRGIAADQLRHQTQQNALTIAQAYKNAVWISYRDVIVPLSSDTESLRTNLQVQEFAAKTFRYFQPMSLVRVNLYNSDGRLLMSTHADGATKLIGNQVSPDTVFAARMLTAPAPDSQWLENIAIEGNERATLLQTVIPIRMSGGNSSEAAIEIIQDISKPWQQIRTFQLYGTAAMVGIFVLFMAILIFSTRKAEAIIARQYETNVELAATAEAAQAENRQKSQFLANISHELRTPLNAIIGFSDIIKNEVILALENKKYHDYINDIHSSGVHLLSLINDILDYSKAEAGKLELEAAEVNVTKLVQNSMRLVAPRAETGKITLIDSLPKEQIIMITDSKKFKQILLNLLSNAVKFTPAGGEVKITAWRDLTIDMYFFEVRDSGIGIAPKDISKALAPFGQVDSALSRKYEGTGLGLPLTKKFVEIMGGTFSIESTVGKGTTVTFGLPRELRERDGIIVKQMT